MFLNRKVGVFIFVKSNVSLPVGQMFTHFSHYMIFIFCCMHVSVDIKVELVSFQGTMLNFLFLREKYFLLALISFVYNCIIL
jgi:hypothetical protein